jgi:hypothetical protein
MKTNSYVLVERSSGNDFGPFGGIRQQSENRTNPLKVIKIPVRINRRRFGGSAPI